MKKLLLIALALLLFAGSAHGESAPTAPAQEDTAAAVYELYDFEGGDTLEIDSPYWMEFTGAFRLQMPALWQNYALSDAQKDNGMIACFGDGSHFLFVGRADDTGAHADIAGYALTLALDQNNASFYQAEFGGTPFVCYADYANGSSNCAAILPGKGVYTFYFYPMDGDPAFAQTVLDLMNSYTAVEAAE